mmetsp:Transcript_39619/g.60921  ORF Transcript_39619/g.60921 Transcript_39619/m.60921 type:complete len:101 (-) Transcript_39619:91-393(-)
MAQTRTKTSTVAGKVASHAFAMLCLVLILGVMLAAVNSTRCQNEITDSEKYRRQALLYASTLSSDVPGSVIFAPEGSDHAFVYHQDYYKWIALQVANKLL